MRVPSWLAHLRVDPGTGLPVPYINCWGQETPDSLTIRYDRNVRDVATWFADDYDAPPDFTRQCPQRQRECMTQRLCQVCHEQTTWEDAHLPVSSMSTNLVDVTARGPAIVVHEPWLCGRCARFAAKVCPALIDRGRRGDLAVVPIRGADEVSLVVSKGWVEGPYEAATRANPVAMWVKAWVLAPEAHEALRAAVVSGWRR